MEWNDSREKLPEQSGEYLVCVRDPDYLAEGSAYYETSYVTSAYYDRFSGLWEAKNGFYCANLDDVNTRAVYYISHWAKLPEVPKR